MLHWKLLTSRLQSTIATGENPEIVKFTALNNIILFKAIAQKFHQNEVRVSCEIGYLRHQKEPPEVAICKSILDLMSLGKFTKKNWLFL